MGAEGTFPPAMAALGQALIKQYGMAPETVRFFTVHVEADEARGIRGIGFDVRRAPFGVAGPSQQGSGRRSSSWLRGGNTADQQHESKRPGRADQGGHYIKENACFFQVGAK